MLSVRPQVDRLSFHLFGRLLHPELFEVFASRSIERQHYQVRYQITNVGHLIAGSLGGVTMAEIASAAQQPLPKQCLLISHEIGFRRTVEIVYRERVRYQCEFQLEQVDQRCFLAFQQALAQQTECEGLFCQFGPSGRLSFGAISYINVESRERSLRVRAFHTFPESCMMMKSSSMFEVL
jgi:hypothetical protein